MTERREEGGSDGVDAHAPTEISGDGTHTGPRSKRSPLSRPTLGRFRIEATLGSGGMGDVYRAHDSVLDRQVALKVLRSEPGREDDEQRRRRVVREARSAAALTHPNTVTIFDVGEDGNDVFIAMELLEGEDLRVKLDRGGASLEQKLRWLREAARALAAAHDRGLVHRDVKPENMFVCNDGTLKLLDFGIAKREEDDAAPESDPERPVESIGPSSFKTAVGRRFGTPRYMAPEQHAGQATDSRTDQYAWGLVAFELLTGSLAIDSLPTQTSDVDTADGAAVPTARFAELRAKVPELPESMARAVQRTLEPKKDDRFASMSEVLEALEPNDTPYAREPEVTKAPAETPLAPPVVPAPPRRSRARWIVPVAVALAALVGTGVAIRVRPRPTKAAAAPVAKCRALSERVVPTGPDDRVGFDASGKLVFARSIHTKLVLQRETADGAVVDIAPPPFFQNLAGTYHDLSVFGLTVGKRPMTAVLAFQGAPAAGSATAAQAVAGVEGIGAFLLLFDADGAYSQRLYGPIGGVSVSRYQDEVIAVVASNGTKRLMGLAPGIDVYFPMRRGGNIVPAEKGFPRGPSIDTAGDRIAVAYNETGTIHFFIVDGEAQKRGDNQEVAASAASPAIVFDGRKATVFWISEANGNSRLTARTLTLGKPTFDPPRMVVDEPATRFVIPRTRSGGAALAWTSSAGGDTLLRFARLDADGVLEAPATIGHASDIRGVFVTQERDDFGEVGWFDATDTLHVSSVTCAGPVR